MCSSVLLPRLNIPTVLYLRQSMDKPFSRSGMKSNQKHSPGDLPVFQTTEQSLWIWLMHSFPMTFIISAVILSTQEALKFFRSLIVSSTPAFSILGSCTTSFKLQSGNIFVQFYTESVPNFRYALCVGYYLVILMFCYMCPWYKLAAEISHFII